MSSGAKTVPTPFVSFDGWGCGKWEGKCRRLRKYRKVGWEMLEVDADVGELWVQKVAKRTWGRTYINRQGHTAAGEKVAVRKIRMGKRANRRTRRLTVGDVVEFLLRTAITPTVLADHAGMRAKTVRAIVRARYTHPNKELTTETADKFMAFVRSGEYRKFRGTMKPTHVLWGMLLRRKRKKYPKKK